MPNVNDIRLLLYAERRGLLDKSLVASCFSDLLSAERAGTPLRVAAVLDRRNLMRPEQTEALIHQMLDVTASGGRVVGSETVMEMTKGVVSSLKAGQVVGPYRLGREVSRDGFGLLFQAKSPGDELVAIRILTPEAASHPRVVTTFEEQARRAVEVDHPNLVKTIEVGLSDGLHYVVSKWCEGRTLGELFQLEAVPPAAILEVVNTLAQTCAFMHRWSMTHLEIKPGRVVIDDDGEFFLVDPSFGKDVLRAETMGTPYCKLLGTPAYLAPEQARADTQRISPQTDVYGLGVLMYRCITGHYPHVGESFVQTLREITTAQPPPLRALRPDAPAALEGLLLQCMARKPRERPSSRQLAEETAGLLEEPGILEMGPPEPEPDPSALFLD